MATRTAIEIPAQRLKGLRRYNLIAGVFHLAQAVAILALSNDFALPVSINYLTGAPVPGTRFETVHVVDVRIAVWVAVFSLLIVWMYWRVAYVPGGQPIAALERFFGAIGKWVKKFFQRHPAARKLAGLGDGV